jgi:MtaA/CmuA family methyltransferase
MTGRELLLKAVRNEPTPRPAWLPFVGCHGGRLIDRSASDYLRSADLLFEGLSRACDLYRPDGLPVVFDLQIEAEILGCALNWADDVPPSVASHPLAGAEIESLPVFDLSRGRIPTVLKALDLLRASKGEEVAFYGLVCGPFTLALHLLGNDIFLEMFDNPERVDRILALSAGVAVTMARGYLDHGADVVAVVDPMTSQISPRHFQQFVTPHVDHVFDAIRAAGGLSSIFVCGDVTRNLELMCRTHADNISVDEQIPIDRLRSLCEASGKSFGGNIKLTSVLLLGDERDAKLETLQILEKAGGRGFVLAPGCDLPYHTPPKNLQAVAEMVHDGYAREVARETLHARDGDAFGDIAMPDYRTQQAVVVDVITLDSSSCAPCQYMMEAVERAAKATRVRTYVNEHKIKVREGLGMMVRLGVQNLPTICIDGEVKFASIIPDQLRLVEAIEEAARAKAGAAT